MKSNSWIVLAIGLYATTTNCTAADDLLGEHIDTLAFDERMSLAEVVETAFERYPQNQLVYSFDEEAKALNQRSESLIAGYPMVYLQYINYANISKNGGVNNIQTGYQVPVWMWGQKDAGQKVADQAQKGVEKYLNAFKHELAGLIRDSLWMLRLAENRLELSRKIYGVAEKLSAVVKRRVELGDLARADMLLAESDRLEKKTNLIQAEAEVMHARKNYQNLTRMDKAPANFDERLSPIKSVDERHPSLAAANTTVERAQAEVEFISRSKQGNQPTVLLGTDSTSYGGSGDYGTGVNMVFQIPVGGDDWHAPQVAQANVVLNEKIVQRERLWRQLEKSLHEAQHNLDVDRVALEIAKERKSIAETQLKMSYIAFESGEIALIDYLKIQTVAFAAIEDHAQREIVLKKDTAVYNQVVGVTP